MIGGSRRHGAIRRRGGGVSNQALTVAHVNFVCVV